MKNLENNDTEKSIYENSQEFTTAFTIEKKPHRSDAIGWMVSSTLIFFITIICALRVTIVGQFLDDVLFAFIFGWFKYIIYLLAISTAVLIYSGIKFKFKKRFLLMVFITFSTICFFISSILYFTQIAIVSDSEIHGKFWNKDIFNIFLDNYINNWKEKSVFTHNQGFKSEHWWIANINTYFNPWAGGGIIGALLCGVFSYLSIIVAIIVSIMFLIMNWAWIFKGHPLYFLPLKNKKKYKRLRILSLKSKSNGKSKRSAIVNVINLRNEIDELEIASSSNESDVTIEFPSYLKNKDNLATIEFNDELIPANDIESPYNDYEYQSVTNTKIDHTQLKTINDDEFTNSRTNMNIVSKTEEVIYEEDPTLVQQPIIRPRPMPQNTVTQQAPNVVAKPVIKKEQKEFVNSRYVLPKIDILKQNTAGQKEMAEARLIAEQKAASINLLFQQFGVNAKVTAINTGPTITKFEITPEPGTKVNSITKLENDLKLTLASQNVRIEAPIQGKAAVGIEIPNDKGLPVSMREVLQTPPSGSEQSKLLFVIGKSVTGDLMFGELDKMPHLLIAGSTGSGKSVMVNGIISSILMRAKPHEVKFIMVDPKKVELAAYARIPHLITPVINDMSLANNVLKKVIAEMDRRYMLFTQNAVKNISGFNSKQTNEEDKLPFYVVIIDELADLMMTANKKDVEDSIMRLTQMARAAGIHLIVATQRPSTDVLTGVIKSNIPTRISFSVTSSIDSRTILDSPGAEKLVGKGDMLYMPPGSSNLLRAQGAYISDAEIEKIVDHCASQQRQLFNEEFTKADEHEGNSNNLGKSSGGVDPMFNEIKAFVIDTQKASTSLIQRKFSIGYNRAAKLIDELEAAGVIGPQNGSKPREVFIQGDIDFE
ncbi:DNA translocase FtsK [Spiroplasma endosymbiont of Crioceris asparagi]|uniref:DNA translocase FtsK n=1 Tax=Spiroplasma endosymbiont of Crioceris asparagi TaxID=3066286 RepID=UPI0030D3E4E2